MIRKSYTVEFCEFTAQLIEETAKECGTTPARIIEIAVTLGWREVEDMDRMKELLNPRIPPALKPGESLDDDLPF